MHRPGPLAIASQRFWQLSVALRQRLLQSCAEEISPGSSVDVSLYQSADDVLDAACQCRIPRASRAQGWAAAFQAEVFGETLRHRPWTAEEAEELRAGTLRCAVAALVLERTSRLQELADRFEAEARTFEGVEGLKEAADRQFRRFQDAYPALYRGKPEAGAVPAGSLGQKGLGRKLERQERPARVVGDPADPSAPRLSCELPEGFRTPPTERTFARRLWIERHAYEAAVAHVTGEVGKSSRASRSLVRARDQATQDVLTELHVCEPGKRESLTTLWECKVASDAARKARLYSMSLALAEAAHRFGLRIWFTTVTLPGEWHRAPTWGPRTSDAVKRAHVWNRASAKDCSDELAKATHRARQNARKHGMFFGLSVKEAHKDGTPHMHEAIFCEEEAILAYMRSLEKNGFEGSLKRGRQKWKEAQKFGLERPNQVRVKEWIAPTSNDHKSSKTSKNPCSYLFKYLLKALGLGEDEDRLWKRTVPFRSYNFFGLRRGVSTLWAAAFRCVKPEKAEDDVDEAEALRRARDAVPRPLLEAHDLIHAGRECEALEALGAFQSEEDWATVAAGQYVRHESATGVLSWRWIGVRFAGDDRTYTETKRWEIVPTRDLAKQPEDGAVGPSTTKTQEFQLWNVTQGGPPAPSATGTPQAGPRPSPAGSSGPFWAAMASRLPLANEQSFEFT